MPFCWLGVAAPGGRIGVEAGVGGGTAFTVRLPVG